MLRLNVRRLAVIAAMILAQVFTQAAAAQTADLTGYWRSDEGAVYRFRQVDDRLFWQVDFAPAVINVFYGVIAGNTITGRWADLPGGNARETGTLGLRIESANRIVKISQGGSYGGTFWERVDGAAAGTPRTSAAGGAPSTSVAGSAGGGTPSTAAAGAAAAQRNTQCDMEVTGCWIARAANANHFYVRIYRDAAGGMRYIAPQIAYPYRHEGVFERSCSVAPGGAVSDSFEMIGREVTTPRDCNWRGDIYGPRLLPGIEGDPERENTNQNFRNGMLECPPGPNGLPPTSSGVAWAYLQDQTKCPAAPGAAADRPAPQPLFDAVAGLGSLWTFVGTDGWTGRWTRRGDTTTFDGEWWKGEERVQTVAEMTRVGDAVTIRRTASTDGWSCTVEGTIQGRHFTGQQRCERAGQGGAPTPFSANIFP